MTHRWLAVCFVAFAIVSGVAAGSVSRLLCNLGLHRWHLMTTGRAGFVKFERCSRGCGAIRTRKGR